MGSVLESEPQLRSSELTHESDAYPWRWDWGVGVDIVSFQEARCLGKNARKPTWIALDSAKDEENLAVHQAAQDAYDAWLAERADRKAARSIEGDSP